jgi:hypothetical protein
MKDFIFSFSFAVSALISLNVLAENLPTQPYLEQQEQQEQREQQLFSDAELAQMLAPIALYPDSLLTHILIAATYPIEIIEAHRWLIKNEGVSSEVAARSVEDFNWDASIKALVPFERILTRLSENLTWTQQLGDAFLQDESRLLESIQLLRQKAARAGNLKKMDNMDVSYEENNIVIEPIEKEIVYIPYYDTRRVYGIWHSVSYPPVYWQPHHSMYVSDNRPFYWHSGIHISFNYFFSAFHWHNRHVVVVNSHHAKHRYYEQRPRRLIVNGGYAKRWTHQIAHRKGVAYRTKNTRLKFNNQQRVKVRETSHKHHSVLQKQLQSHSRKNLSVTHHKSNKRYEAKAHSIQNKVIKPTSKQHVSIDKSTKLTPKNTTSKTYNKTTNKYRTKLMTKTKNTSTRNIKQHSTYQKKQRRMSVKKSHSKTKKERH